MVYKPVKLQITPKQQKAAIKGAKMRLSQNCIGQGQLVMMHPLNYKKVVNAKGGINLELSPGEIMQTAAYHNLVPKISGDLSGEGIFDSIWSGIKSVGRFLKDTGIASAVLDVAQGVAGPIIGEDVAKAVRGVAKSVTGVGIGSVVKKRRGRPFKSSGEGLYLGSARGSGLYL